MTITPTSPAVPATITNLANATTPVSGGEFVAIVQNGKTVKATLNQTALPGQVNSVVAGTGIAVVSAAGVATVSLVTPIAVVNGGTGATSLTNLITNVDLAQMPADTIKGNNTAGTANAADLTVTQTNTLLGITSNGTASVGQLPGTTTNDNAASGNIGEIISSNIASGAAVSVSNNTAKDITSISLTAGDWDVWGNIAIQAASTTTVTAIIGWMSGVSATNPGAPNNGAFAQLVLPFTASQLQVISAGSFRVSVNTTTSVFLSTFVSFSISTCTAYGYIAARRRR